MAREDVGSLLPEKFVIGLSSILGITALAGQNACSVKYASGGSLEIGGTAAMTTGGITAFTWGNGYLMGTSEIFNANMMGTFYVAATGATVTCFIMRGMNT